MAKLAPTANLGLALPDPASVEPFRTTDVNEFFNLIDTEVGVARAALSNASLLVSNGAPSLVIPATGAFTTVATVTWTAAKAGRIMVNTQTTVTNGGNYAGYLQILVNGTQIGSGYRVANFASPAAMVYSRAVKALQIVGLNTVLIRMNAESGGLTYTANNTLTEVWAD